MLLSYYKYDFNWRYVCNGTLKSPIINIHSGQVAKVRKSGYQRDFIDEILQ